MPQMATRCYRDPEYRVPRDHVGSRPKPPSDRITTNAPDDDKIKVTGGVWQDRIVNVDVRCAGPGDVEKVIEILAEASAWLRQIGITQWPDRLPRTLILGAIEQQDVYLAISGDEIAATLTLQWSDPSFWGERDDAGFVHRLAVRRSHAGLGAWLIDWAEQQAANRGRMFICLDCLSTNTRLRRYYEVLGFRPVTEIVGPEDHPHGAADGPWRATLYERAIIAHGSLRPAT